MISNPPFIVGGKVESSCQQIIRAIFISLTHSQQSTVNSQQSTSTDGATGIDIMLLAYPKIPDSKNCPNEQCVAFEKYDGTNLHWVWEVELGWYAFGTRRSRFDLDEMGIAEFNAAHPGLEEAPEIFKRDFASPLDSIFRENEQYHCPEITVFTEFFGANSFAGKHKKDDRKQLVLFDVETEGGMVVPDRFIQDFGKLNIARVIYRGKLTGKFMDDLRQGKYGVDEGVVCKGGRNPNNLWMVKIKTDAYMQRLQQAFKDDWENYWE